MTKRKAYDKPRIAVEDFVLNQFIAGPCRVQINKSISESQLRSVPLYDDMMNSGYFAANIGLEKGCNLNVYAQGDDMLCYHTQGGARGVFIAS